MNNSIAIALAVAFGALAGAVHAGVVLSDDFESDAYALNFTGDASFNSLPVASTSGNGGVASTDLVGPGFFAGLCGDGTKCVDLDGTTGGGNTPSSVLESTAMFAPGVYTLSFGLNGNSRGAPSQTTTVTLDGVTVAAITLASNAAYQTYTYTVTTTGTGTLDFVESGPSTQQGALLDNVSLSSVPEPASWALMLAGFTGIGAAVRGSRRKSIVSAA